MMLMDMMAGRDKRRKVHNLLRIILHLFYESPFIFMTFFNFYPWFRIYVIVLAETWTRLFQRS